MTTIDVIKNAIELIRDGQADEAANELEALVEHLDNTIEMQRRSYKAVQDCINNALNAANNLRAITRSEKFEKAYRANQARLALRNLGNLVPSERRPVTQPTQMKLE